jgi:hypothetical protein
MIGEMWDVYQAAQEAFRVGEEMGLPPQGVLVSFYGFPTMPKPWPLGPGGVNRLPPGLRPQWAGHPALWLDPEDRVRRPQEHDQEWLIRIYLQLLARGYLHPELDGDHSWTDALLLMDIDTETPQGRQRVERWMQGEPDQLLDELRLEDGELGEMGGRAVLDWEAHRLWLEYEQAWVVNAIERQQELIQRVWYSHQLFNPSRDWGEVLAPLQQLLAAGEPLDRFELVQRAQRAQAAIQSAHQACSLLQVCQAVGQERFSHLQLQLEHEAQLAQLLDRAQQLQGQVLRGDPAAPAQLVQFLHQWLQRQVQLGQQLRQQQVAPQWVNGQVDRLEAALRRVQDQLAHLGPPPAPIWWDPALREGR